MTRVALAVRVVAGLATTALTLGLATVVAPSAVAQRAGPDPLSGVYLLDVDLYACAFDDPDDATEFKPPRICVDPPGAAPTSPDYTEQTRVDLLALAGAVRGELEYGGGLRFPWGRGPFLDANGVGALPEDGPVRMCFKDQRATWGYFGGTDMFGVTSRIGLFRGSINFGCDPDDLLAEADVTVYAPPNGQRVCGQTVHLERDDDWVEAQLCLRNTRLDPQPAARTVGPSRGLAPFVAELDATPSVVPTGARSYSWDFGDGITSDQGPRVVHRFERPGSYPVTLAITDLAGRTRSRTVLTIEAQNLPVASFTGPANVPAGGLASFDASRSATGNGTNGWIQRYQWTFGDGTAPVKVHRNSGTATPSAASTRSPSP
jgi:hypothetical protein